MIFGTVYEVNIFGNEKKETAREHSKDGVSSRKIVTYDITCLQMGTRARKGGSDARSVSHNVSWDRLHVHYDVR